MFTRRLGSTLFLSTFLAGCMAGSGLSESNGYSKTTTKVSDFPTALVAGKFRANGHIGFAITHAFERQLTLLSTDGSGNVDEQVKVILPAVADGVTVADLNQDGRDDVVAFSTEKSELYVMYSLPGQKLSFTAPAIVKTLAKGPVSIASGDVLGTGSNQVLVASKDGKLESFGVADNATLLSVRVEDVKETLPNPIFLKDLNRDGKADLLALRKNPYFKDRDLFMIRMATPGGNFTSDTHVYSVSDDPVSLDTADVDGDGQVDVAIASFFTSKVKLFLKGAAPTYANTIDFDLEDMHPRKIQFGDLDGDGKPDLAIAATKFGSAEVQIYYGRGDGFIQAQEKITLGEGLRDMVLADLTGSGQLDVITIDFDQASLNISRHIKQVK